MKSAYTAFMEMEIHLRVMNVEACSGEAWFKFFAIKHDQLENSNELFQKLLEDLKELAEYDNSSSKDRPIFLNDNEEHYVQNEESLENSSKEIDASNPNQEKEEPPQDSDIHQLVEECSIEVSKEQKQSMEDTIVTPPNWPAAEYWVQGVLLHGSTTQDIY
nr:hypothetical protein [Tanacetum cinerariifolium]